MYKIILQGHHSYSHSKSSKRSENFVHKTVLEALI